MQNYVCIRHHRIKAFGWGSTSAAGPGFGCVGRWAHHLRLVRTPNADATLSGDICISTKDTGWAPQPLRESPHRQRFRESSFLADRVKERLSALGIERWRRDAVLVEELLLTISPEFLRDGDERNSPNPGKIRRAREAKLEYLQDKYGDNLIAFVDHPDERNYHAMAFVVPALLRPSKRRGRPPKHALNPEHARESIKRWTLCAKHMFSRSACSKAQEEFAAVCQRHGLDVRRGVKGSRTPHRQMRAHLALVESPADVIPFIQVPEPGGILETKKAYAERAKASLGVQVEKANGQLALYHAKALELDRVSSAQKAYQQSAADSQGQVLLLREQIARLENENAELKTAAQANADKVRDIGLDRVAAALGYQAAQGRPGVFNTPFGTLEVREKRFIFPEANLKGRNAVDLVKAATQSDFTTAVRWLVGSFPDEARGAAASHAADQCEARMRAVSSAGSLSIADQATVFAPVCAHRWPAMKKEMRSTVGAGCEEAENAKQSGLLAATTTHALRVNLSLPEEGNKPSGVALLNPRDFRPLQVIGSGCAVLRPERKPEKITFVEDLAEALALGQLDRSRRSILVPFQRDWSAAFWAWVLEHVKRVDLAAAKGRLDWVVSCAEAAFARSGRLFDGLLDALFTHVQPQAGAWANELQIQTGLQNSNEKHVIAQPAVRVR